MTEPLEQLVFGWSETGLQGRNRLQMVATSPGWREDNRYRRAARRLCRLDAAGDRDPIAFGWADLGGRRLVFQRRMVASSTGDVRRLVAHVVAGDPSDLPIEHVLRAFDSGFWWDGSPLDPVLPTALPQEIDRGWQESRRPRPTAVADPLLGRILGARPGAAVAFDGTPQEVHAALWAIHRRVPELLETLSCSTYETGQMTGWFDVAGLDGRPRPRNAEWCPRNATVPRYDAGQLRDLSTMLGPAREELLVRNAESPKVYREVLRIASQVLAGKAESIPRLLTRKRTLGAVLATQVGIHAVADAVWALDRQKWPRVAAADAQRKDTIRRLAIAAANAAQPHSEVTLGVVTRRLNDINPGASTEFVNRILQRRAASERLPAPDQDFLAAAAAWVEKADQPDSVVQTLLEWIDQNLNGAILADKRLPDLWRGVLFESARTTDVLDVEDYADLATRHPRLFATSDWLPTDKIVVERLHRAEEPLRGFAARAVAETWTSSETLGLALRLHAEGHISATIAVLDALGRRPDVTLAVEESHAAWRALADLALAAANGRAQVGLFALPWRLTKKLAAPEAGEAWATTAADIIERGRGNYTVRTRAWTDAIATADGADREALVQLALHDIALTSPAGWAFEGRLTKLPTDVIDPRQRAKIVLVALEQRAQVTEAFLPILVYGLRTAVHRTGFLRLRLSAGDCDDAAQRLVARVRDTDASAFTEVRINLDRPVAKWLRTNGALR